MTRRIRLWQRDMNVRQECARSALLAHHVAILAGFSSDKKAAERLCLLHRAGILRRMPYFQPAARGKPALAYVTGPLPHPRTLCHTMGIADVHIQVAQWARRDATLTAEFYYGHEVVTSAGIMPDAALLIHAAAHKTGLVFIEEDNGTEVIASTTRYSVAKKLAAYAAYFDAGTYAQDFAWAGALRGFRVCLIVPAGRWRFVQHLVATEQHDFVLTTSVDRLKEGLHQPIWQTHDGTSVDLLGRRGREMVGEMVRPTRPTNNGDNS